MILSCSPFIFLRVLFQDIVFLSSNINTMSWGCKLSVVVAHNLTGLI